MADVIQMHFTTADYVIFALLLVASAGIGLFYAFSGGRQRTTQVERRRRSWVLLGWAGLSRAELGCDVCRSS